MANLTIMSHSYGAPEPRGTTTDNTVSNTAKTDDTRVRGVHDGDSIPARTPGETPPSTRLVASGPTRRVHQHCQIGDIGWGVAAARHATDPVCRALLSNKMTDLLPHMLSGLYH